MTPHHSRTKRHPAPRCPGFSVIEVLVLAAAMAVLAALLLPVLAQGGNPFERALAAARRASCRSNLKQLGMGILMYCQDYDEKYPLIASARVTASMPPYAHPYGWADAILPYLKYRQIYQCPSEVNGPDSNAAHFGFIDYYFNSNLNAPIRGRQGRRVPRSARLHLSGVLDYSLTDPTKTVLAGEGMNGDARYNRTSSEADARANSGRPNRNAPNRIHDGSGNYLMADTHVLWLAPAQVYGGVQTSRKNAPGAPANLGHFAATHLIQ